MAAVVSFCHVLVSTVQVLLERLFAGKAGITDYALLAAFILVAIWFVRRCIKQVRSIMCREHMGAE